MSISTPMVKQVPGGPVRVATAALAAVIALVLGGCGDDQESTTEAVSPDTTTEAALSPEQTIERAGNEWAALFAADGFSDSCERMTQPLCERIACERVGGPIKNCTPPTAAFRKSFEDATVEDVAIKGRKAAARFSNGETVEAVEANGGLIHKIGGNVGREVFEGARSKSCGTWDRYRLVVEGDISCPHAIRVVNRDGYTFPGSWFCDGPDGNVVCTQRTTEPGIVISACVPRSLRSWDSRRCSEMQRQAIARSGRR